MQKVQNRHMKETNDLFITVLINYMIIYTIKMLKNYKLQFFLIPKNKNRDFPLWNGTMYQQFESSN